jgi:predicted anti-sigma-YlaC factor YlaD
MDNLNIRKENIMKTKMAGLTAIALAMVLMSGIAEALGIVTYWQSSPMYIPMNSIQDTKYYQFEIQNAGDDTKTVSIALESKISYIEITEYSIPPKSSTKISLPVRFPSGLDYRAGDYADTTFYVSETLQGSGIALKKGISEKFRAIIGDKGQMASRPLSEVPTISSPNQNSGNSNNYNPPIVFLPPENKKITPDAIDEQTEQTPEPSITPSETPEQNSQITAQVTKASGFPWAIMAIIIAIILVFAVIYFFGGDSSGKIGTILLFILATSLMPSVQASSSEDLNITANLTGAVTPPPSPPLTGMIFTAAIPAVFSLGIILYIFTVFISLKLTGNMKEDLRNIVLILISIVLIISAMSIYFLFI